MTTEVFRNIWYRPDKCTWREAMSARAFKDSGILILGQNSLEFRGKNYIIQIPAADRITFEKQGAGVF
jgi:hypothetical protein